MGPAERAAVRLVAAEMWPENPASRMLGTAVVLAARRVDVNPRRARWRAELDGAVKDLHMCGDDRGRLWELRAEYVLRQCRVTEADLAAGDAEPGIRLV